jgi:hypothetical protein
VSPPRIWKTGERCRVTAGGRSTDSVVAIASPNGKSIAVAFEALRTPRGLFVNGAALLWDDARAGFFDVKGSGEQFTLDEIAP